MLHEDGVGIAVGHQAFLVFLGELHLHPADLGEDGPGALGLQASAVHLQVHPLSEHLPVLADEAADVEEGERTTEEEMTSPADVAVYLFGCFHAHCQSFFLFLGQQVVVA